jgi:hypothetical protein
MMNKNECHLVFLQYTYIAAPARAGIGRNP